ncbi:MAG: glycosyltransferase family 9 protein [Candidatus Latescibacterota bacterium]
MKILLVRTGGLGDSILTLPVGSHLKRYYPEAELHILGNSAMLEAAALTGEYSGFHSIDEAGFSTLFSESGTTGFLRDYFSGFERVYFFSSGNAECITRKVLRAGAGYCRVFDPRLPEGFHDHITSHLLSILETPSVLPAEFPSPVLESASKRNTGALVIHPGSGGIPKMWPLERFFEIADFWTDPEKVVFLLGPAEIERGLPARIPSRYGRAMPETLRDAFDILSSASFYLGNDSGVSHLAALARTPSVVLFGLSDPAVWRPLGSRVTIVASSERDMDGIEIDEVIKALKKISRSIS